jgi:hypothetical protein
MKNYVVKLKETRREILAGTSMWGRIYGIMNNLPDGESFRDNNIYTAKYYGYGGKTVGTRDIDAYLFTPIKDTTILIGDIVVTNGDGSKRMDFFLEGKVGEITDKYIYIFHNDEGHKGTNGEINPETMGYAYSFRIHKTNSLGGIAIIFRQKARKDEHGTICYHCKGKYKKEDMRLASSKKYCVDCFEKLFTICQHCNNIVNKKKVMDIKGKTICLNCLQTHYFTCIHCGEKYLISDLKMYQEEKWCKGCFDNNFKYCESCEEIHNIRNMKKGVEGDWYCADCWGERFGKCSRCNKVDWQENLHLDEERGRYFCPECWIEEEKRNYIRDYGYSPNEFSMNKNKWDVPLFLGIELEVQKSEKSKKDVLALAKELTEFLKGEKKEKLFYFKRDGSVPNGFEIVTHPFTLQYAHRNIKFQKMLKWMKANDFSSEESGMCGLHVHASKEFYNDLDITKMRLFFSKNKEKIYEFSRRKGVGDDYCAYEKWDKNTIKQMLNGDYPPGRRLALNMNSSKETIEFRLFRGTLDEKAFLASLQFVDAISHFVKKHGISSFIHGEHKYKENSWELFIDWAKEDNNYNHMLKYMKGAKICA